MLRFKKDGMVELAESDNLRDEDWKIIAGAATLTGYGVKDAMAAKNTYTSLARQSGSGTYCFNPDMSAQLRMMYGQEEPAQDTDLAAMAAEKAEDHFGITNNLSLAGYIDTNGNYLNLSGDGFTRDRDHREIREVFDEIGIPHEGYSGALIKFMDMGNIRLGVRGVDISECPNEKQWLPLMHFLRNAGTESYVDLSTKNEGARIGTLVYHPETLPFLKEDLTRFFETGRLPGNTV